MKNNNTYQYTFQKGKKYVCPICQKSKKYNRYIDIITGELLPEKYGWCERRNNCGYELNPYKDNYHKKDRNFQSNFIPQKAITKEIKPTIYIPKSIFDASLCRYDKNKFVQLLKQLFGEKRAMQLVLDYWIGTSSFWDGATVFWIFNEAEQITGGQVVLFDKKGSTCKTFNSDGSIKKRYTSWVHTALKSKFQKQSKAIPKWLIDYSENTSKFPVPFGLQAIHDHTKPIAVVEAPKTAIIASGFYPQYNWLALGALSWINNIHRLTPLAKRNITLFPDKGGYELWKQKADEYSHLANFVVSDLLERKDAKPKSDLADYLIQFGLHGI